MTRRVFTAFISLIILACAIFPAAAADLGTYSWSGEWETDWGKMTLTQNGANVTGDYDYDDGRITGTVSGDTLTGTWLESPSYAPPHDAGEVEFVMSADGKSFTGKWRYGSEGDWGNWDGGIRTGEPALTEQTVYGNASGWATAELQEAVDNGLYPDILKGADLTKPITRAEFAAVGILLYEALSGTKASPAPASTFTDTSGTEVLKAYALNIVDGIGGGKFAPNELLNREQAATILTRVYKKLNWEGWTLAGDASYTAHSLDNKGVPLFADDAQISGYAKASVYFMVKYEIIKGLGNNKFGPKNTTSAETAAGYANATREQALLISNRTFENADSIVDGGPVTEQPSTSSTNTSVAGAWEYHLPTGTMYDVHITYVFRNDGTYHQLVRSTYDYSCNAYKGSYKISNGQISFTGRSKVLFAYDKPDYQSLIAEAETKGYKPCEDEVKPFEFSSDSIKIGDTYFTAVAG
jgi:hypothetical protein